MPIPRFRFAFFLLLLILSLPGTRARAAESFAQEKCSLCHIRQSVYFDPRFAGPDGLKGFGEERICASCHNGAVRDSRATLWRGAQHPSPVQGDKGEGKRCSRCHNPHSKGGWSVVPGPAVSLWSGGDAVCSGCHKEYSSTRGSVHEKGFGEGGCRECHRAHGGVGKSLLKEPKEVLCVRCHASVTAERGGGHPGSSSALKAKAGKDLPGCTECHPPHRARASREFAMGRCAGCHEYARNEKKGEAKRHPFESNCLECHSFHSKSGDGGRKFRGREIAADQLCGKCHDPFRAESVGKAKEKGTHVTVVSGKKEEICFRCHRIHRGTAGTPLLVSGKAYSCLACHEEQNTIREYGGIDLAHPVFERVAKGRLDEPLQRKKIRLGTKGEIVCETCHDVHKAARNTSLLARGAMGSEACFWCHGEYRGKGHAPKSEAGRRVECETCHPIHGKRDLGEDPWKSVCTGCHSKGESHRLERIDGAKGKPKDLPGFDARGRKTAFGRISCPTCHDPHGAPAGEKSVRKEYSASGFLCTACHRDRESVALTSHDLRGIAGRNVCEPCHVPHGGKSPLMWGFETRTVETGEESCRSCHREKGMGIPVPKGEGHPTNMIVSRPLPDAFPLIGASGTRQKAGAVSCPTCHEVHGMGFIPSGKGTGKLLRGDCLSCHPGRKMNHGDAGCERCHPPHRKFDTGSICRTCHEVRKEGVAKHPAHDGKGCNSCHRLHDEGKQRDYADRTCIQCHPRQGRIEGSAHGSDAGRSCIPCHPAHRDSQIFKTERRAWDDAFSADLPCLGCHRENGTGPVPKWTEHPKVKKKVPTSYGATVSLETPIIMFSRLREGGRSMFPLYDENGKPAMSGRMGCLTCHDPHAASTVKEGDGSRSAAGYLRDPSGIFLAEVCESCHRENGGEYARKFHDIRRKTD